MERTNDETKGMVENEEKTQAHREKTEEDGPKQ
jgi:hypothetical protein